MVPDITRRRFPKVLADELSAALAAVRGMDQDLVGVLLENYRRNMVKSIGTWGLFNAESPVTGLEIVPTEHLRKIEKLDEAFQKLHRFRKGGASDYVALTVANEIAKAKASLPRQRARKADSAEVAEYLKSNLYQESKNQKKLILEAAVQFRISERTVRKIAAEAGITVTRKRSTAT